jgi:guanine deaminase
MIPMLPEDEAFLRLAISLARQGRERGGHPFGAALVRDGVVVHQVYDRCVEYSDPTFHSELSLIGEYCRDHHVMSLEGYSLYASTEPCPMCAGAIHWAPDLTGGVQRVAGHAPGALQRQPQTERSQHHQHRPPAG